MAKERKRMSEATIFSVARAEEILTARDLARYLRCHVSTLYRLVNRGEIPHFRLGSDIRFRRSAIEKWLDEQGPRGKQRREP
jgi:excisionase family DNA binding protein